MARMLSAVILAGLFLVSSSRAAPTPAEIEKQILEQANAYRKENDRKPLSIDPALVKIAQAHAGLMAMRDKYGDSDKNGHIMDGKNPLDRFKEAKYPFLRMAENVGWNKGFTDPAKQMVKDWIDSEGHRKNLLNPEVTHTGIGAARGASGKWYFVHLFSLPRGKPTRLSVLIENRTGQTIRFRIGRTPLQLRPGQKDRYAFTTTASSLSCAINWPGSEKEAEEQPLRDRTRYAFVRDGDKYRFQQIGPLE